MINVDACSLCLMETMPKPVVLKGVGAVQARVAQYGQDWKKIACLVGTSTPVQTWSKYLWLIQEKEKENVQK